MPRPTARPLPPRPVAALPRWVPAVVGAGLLVATAAVILWQVDQTNQQLQAEHRVVEDPVLGPWLVEMRAEIEAREPDGGAPAMLPGGRRLPEAIWLGRVRSVGFSTPQGERPRLSSVELGPAHLLAGRRSPLDPRGNAGVAISVMGFQWPRGEPRQGESWVFAVYRINKGNNVAQAAYPAP